MAKTTKYFKSAQALATWLDGEMLPSGVLAVVLNETGDDIDEIQVSTNGVTKHFEKYVTVGDQMAERLQEELEEAQETITIQQRTIHDLQGDVDYWHDRWDTCYEELQEANETIATQQETIATLNVTITQKDAIIAERDATIATQSATIQDLQAQLATANATITSLQADLTNYDNQLQLI